MDTEAHDWVRFRRAKESPAMNRFTVPLLFSAALMALSLPAVAHAQTAVSSFDKIAEGGNGQAGYAYREVGYASVNQAGRVAFVGQNLSRFQGIYSIAGGATTTIADPTFGGFGYLRLNSSGTVVFQKRDSNNTPQLYTGNGGALTYVSDPASAPGLPNFVPSGLGFQTIADNGAVTYSASSYNAATTTSTYYVGTAQNGVFTSQAQFGQNFNNTQFQGIEDVHSNNNGQIAYRYNTYNGSSYTQYVYRRNANGTTTTIASGGLQPVTYLGFNDAGQVLYTTNNNYSLLLGNGATTLTIGTPTTLDPVTGRTLGGYASGYGDWFSLNNLGQAVFKAGGNQGGAPQGIYVGNGTSIITVAQIGGALFGSTITGLDLSPQAINDAGQVVFTARLADGRTEVLRGTLPGATGSASAPEPASLALLMPALVGAATVVRRRKRAA